MKVINRRPSNGEFLDLDFSASASITTVQLYGMAVGAAVAGLMLALLKRVPKEGDRIVWAGWRFEIVDMDGRRVDKVLASREDTGADGGG